MAKWEIDPVESLMRGLLAPCPGDFDQTFEAFERVVPQIMRDVSKKCKRELYDQRDVEDCANTVLERLCATIVVAYGSKVPEGSPVASLKRLDPQLGLEAWVLGIITRNEIRNFNRRRKKEGGRFGPIGPSHTEGLTGPEGDWADEPDTAHRGLPSTGEMV